MDVKPSAQHMRSALTAQIIANNLIVKTKRMACHIKDRQALGSSGLGGR